MNNIKLTTKQKELIKCMKNGGIPNRELLVCGNLFSLFEFSGITCFCEKRTINSLEKKGILEWEGNDVKDEFAFYKLTELGKNV